ncbi:hypothetical protein ACQ4PT_002061 [Festuca glaucescens]
MERGDKAMATHWGTIQQPCSKWHGIQEETEARLESGANIERKMVRAFDAYRDDSKAKFKFLHVFTRIETCEKWREVHLMLAKTKDGVYNSDALVPAATDGRPEGRKKAKVAKAMGPPGERLQASIDQCMADAKTRAIQRDEKFYERWKVMLQGIKIDLLKTNVTAKKTNTDLAFLMGGNTAAMDDEVKAWYMAECGLIMNQLREPTAPPNSTPVATATPSSAPTATPIASPSSAPTTSSTPTPSSTPTTSSTASPSSATTAEEASSTTAEEPAI